MALISAGTAANAINVLYMATYAVTQLKLPPTTGLFAGILGRTDHPPRGADRRNSGGPCRPQDGRPLVYGLILLLIYPAFLYLNASPTLGTLVAIVVLLGALNAMGGAAIIITLLKSSRPRCARRECRLSMRSASRSSAASDSSS